MKFSFYSNFTTHCDGSVVHFVIERKLVFTFAICRRLSVNLCALLRLLKFSAMFLRHLIPWPSLTFW